ncbi:MAG: phospholipid carrier-dependent glycosyltransferase [Thermomicrobiales bacterium]|nr:phospholipid carrier-dependent glycosyltransferase [Thermomicrobiales bacterium]
MDEPARQMHAAGVRGRTVLRAAAGLFLTLLACYLLTHGGEFYSSDGYVMYETAKALALRHTIVLDPNSDLAWQIVEGQHGLYFSKYGLGQPLLAAIPILLAKALREVALGPIFDQALYLYAVSLFNQLVTAATGVLVFLLALRLGNGIRLACGLALAWGLTTLAWPYSKTFFSEPLFTACLLMAALGLLAYRQISGNTRFAWLALASLGLGYAVLTRVVGALLIPPFLLYAIWAALPHPEGAAIVALSGRLRRVRQRRALPPDWKRSVTTAALAFGVPALACLALLLWHNAARFGSPLNNGYAGERFDTPLLSGLAGLLISPGKSLFLYAPLTALAVVGWPRFWREQRATAALYAAIAVIVLIQNAKWWSWWGGWVWGPRMLVPLLPFAILGLGPLLRSSATARVAAWILAALGVGVALLGSIVDFNPYLIEIHAQYEQAGRGNADPDIYWHLSTSPIVEHVRRLWDGRDISVITFNLQKIGFSDLQANLFVGGVAIMGVVGVALLFGVLRRSDSAIEPEHEPCVRTGPGLSSP